MLYDELWRSCLRIERQRRAYTVVEIIVSISIVAVLLAILIPAIQDARSSARRVECASKLRQVGLAVMQYHESFGRFPPGSNRGYSLFTAILPYLDAAANMRSINFDKNPRDEANAVASGMKLPVLSCPADPLVNSVGTFGMTSYQGNIGSGLHVSGKPNGVFQNIKYGTLSSGTLDLRSVTDGSSNTIALSEALVGGGTNQALRKIFQTERGYLHSSDSQALIDACNSFRTKTQSPGDRWAKGGKWLRGDHGYSLYNHSSVPNHESCTNEGDVFTGVYTASSTHAAGVNSAYCDGSVRFVAEAIDLTVWRSAGTRSGGETTPEF